MPENTTQKDTKWLITCGLLVLCCFLLTAILLTLHKNNQNGRYALHVDNKRGFSFYVLDTKTSHVWYRYMSGEMRCIDDLGTTKKAIFEERRTRGMFSDLVEQPTTPQQDIFDQISPDKH